MHVWLCANVRHSLHYTYAKGITKTHSEHFKHQFDNTGQYVCVQVF